ncbi:uncharacterized protein J3R85_012038 [Psidium guajava]|nr:uncharacterized protein J3R85_012038 [Psidium guajava]
MIFESSVASDLDGNLYGINHQLAFFLCSVHFWQSTRVEEVSVSKADLRHLRRDFSNGPFHTSFGGLQTPPLLPR